jgi:hypothetical protein
LAQTGQHGRHCRVETARTSVPHRLQVSFVVGEGDEQPYLHRLWVGGTQDVTFCVDVSDAE